MKPRVFVVMPFGKKQVRPEKRAQKGRKDQKSIQIDFNSVYTKLIKPAVELAGGEPFRADEEPGAGDIRTDMFFELVTADFVLADISIINANVFYELGVRHGVAERGVLMIHGGWTQRPFDVAPDRTFDYEGKLFETTPKGSIAGTTQKVKKAVETLGQALKNAIKNDLQTIGSPVFKELKGLKPADWSQIQTAKSKYFHGILDDSQRRVDVALEKGYPGDILTLAQQAPTRLHGQALLLKAAKGLINLHRFQAARKILEDLLKIDPKNFDGRCQSALVLGRLGDTSQARAIIEKAANERPGDPEAQGILGRVYKDMWRVRWEKIGSLQERQHMAVQHSNLAGEAIRSYEMATKYKLNSYYNGINVVSLLRLLEHLNGATRKQPTDRVLEQYRNWVPVVRMAAQEALDRSMPKNDHDETIWARATLGELSVIEGGSDEALQHYSDVVASPGITYFKLDSMQSQLRLFTLLGFNNEIVESVIRILQEGLRQLPNPAPEFNNVVVCSGHMIDAPGRDPERFPLRKEKPVRNKMRAQLEKWGVGSGDLAIAGGARGADIIFAELCVDCGMTVKQLLPLDEEDFLEESVRLPNSHWEERFFALAQTCETAYQPDRLGPLPDTMSVFERNNLWCLNTARVEADRGRLHAIIVWDEKPTGDGPGGTSHFAKEVKRLGARLAIVNPTKL